MCSNGTEQIGGAAFSDVYVPQQDLHTIASPTCELKIFANFFLNACYTVMDLLMYVSLSLSLGSHLSPFISHTA